MVKYEARDVFVDVAYANQLRRLSNSGGGKAPLPPLPQLYVDATRIGTPPHTPNPRSLPPSSSPAAGARLCGRVRYSIA